MKTTPRELDTILASLRMWQARADRMSAEQLLVIDKISTAHGPGLSAAEIDDLCQRLKMASPAQAGSEPAVEAAALIDAILDTKPEDLTDFLTNNAETFAELATKLRGRRYRNHYECVCGNHWSDTWDCMCNDRCPVCNREIEPVRSEDLFDTKGGT